VGTGTLLLVPYTAPVDVLLLLARGGEVLLARRQNTGYSDGMWNLPSGKLEDGEDVVAAMIRESDEEIGLRLEREDLRVVSTVHWRTPEGGGRVGFFFTADRWDGEPENREPHKCSDLRWFPLDRLPAETVPYTAAGIDLYRRGENFGVPGWETALR